MAKDKGKEEMKEEMKALKEALEAKTLEFAELARHHDEALNKVGELEEKLEAGGKELGEALDKIAELTAKNEELNTALFDRETGGKDVYIEPDVEEPDLDGDDLALLESACAAYKIGEEHIVKMRIEVDENGGKTAVVLTAGGSKVSYHRGDEKRDDFMPLTPIQVDGKVRRKMRPVTGPKGFATEKA